MGEVEAQEAGGITVERNLVVLAYVSNYCIDVRLRVTKYKGVIDVDDDVRRFRRGYPIELTIAEYGHDIPFCEECLLVVPVEDAAGSERPLRALAMRYSWAGLRPHTVAIWGSRVVTIQSASGGRGALR